MRAQQRFSGKVLKAFALLLMMASLVPFVASFQWWQRAAGVKDARMVSGLVSVASTVQPQKSLRLAALNPVREFSLDSDATRYVFPSEWPDFQKVESGITDGRSITMLAGGCGLLLEKDMTCYAYAISAPDLFVGAEATRAASYDRAILYLIFTSGGIGVALVLRSFGKRFSR